jgi:hypothetical protein
MVTASRLNSLWQRVLFEAQALKVSCQPQLASIVGDLILGYLDSNL